MIHPFHPGTRSSPDQVWPQNFVLNKNILHKKSTFFRVSFFLDFPSCFYCLIAFLWFFYVLPSIFHWKNKKIQALVKFYMFFLLNNSGVVSLHSTNTTYLAPLDLDRHHAE